MYTGSCLCGAVAFEIEGELEPIQVCHCSQCRKAQGSAFAANIPVSASAYRLVKGEEVLRAFESSPGKHRVFCRECGSPMFSKRDDLPQVLRIRSGCIDGELAVRPVAHFHYASKANWFDVDDGLPKFPEAYERGTS